MTLADRLYPGVASRPGLVVGINGPPGCGKSTLAAAMVQRARADGARWVGVSIDDFYVSRAESALPAYAAWTSRLGAWVQFRVIDPGGNAARSSGQPRTAGGSTLTHSPQRG